jgi:hypothetical protein
MVYFLLSGLFRDIIALFGSFAIEKSGKTGFPTQQNPARCSSGPDFPFYG